MGKMGAHELNYSSDIDLIVLYDADAPALADGRRAGRAVRAHHARAGEADAGAHRRRLCVPHRSAAASRSGLDRRSRSRRSSALNYYESTGQNWERAAMIKARPCAGDVAAGERSCARSSPFIWRKYLDFGAVADVHAMKRQMARLQGPRRDRDRRPQHQARARRHPRDRVLRADAAADRGRAPSGIARARDARDARRRSPKGGWIGKDARARPRRRLSFPARHRASPADGRRRADPHAAGGARRRSSASRAFSGSPTATPLPPRCSSTCARCSANMRGCSRTRPRPRPRAARSPFRPTRTTPRRSTSSPRWASAVRSKCRARCAAGSRANTAR